MMTIVIIHTAPHDLLDTCIQSCMSQSVHPDKIIVLNNTDQDLGYLLKKSNIVKIIKSKLQNFNDVISLILSSKIESEYLNLLYSNDLIYKNQIEKSIKALNDYPEVGLVYSDFDQISLTDKSSQRIFCHPYDVRILLMNNIIPPNYCIRYKLLPLITKDNRQINIHPDYNFILKFASHNLALCIPEPLFCNRVLK